MNRMIVLVLLACAAFAEADSLPRRGFFGVQAQPISDSLRAQLKGVPSGGVYVAGVISKSSAAEAEIKVGDVITSIERTDIADVGSFMSTIAKYKAEAVIQVGLVRMGTKLTTDVALKPYPKENPGDFDVIYESVMVNDSLRRIIFTKPRKEGKLPLVVMLGGIGCYSLDLPPEQAHPYRTLLYEVTRAGFATLRVEKTGMGDSQGPSCATESFFDEVDGYVAALRDLPRFSFVDTSRVILLGHSMGGIVAPVLANRYPVKGIVAIATSGIWWVEYELANQRRQLLLAGMDYDSIEIAQKEKELAMHKLFVEKLKPDEILKDHPELEDDLMYPAYYTFMQEVANLNLAHEWKTVTAKSLFVYGGADFITDRAEHQYAVDLLNHYHPGSSRYVEVPNMDHFFTKIGSQQESFDNMNSGRPNREFSSDVVPVVTGWCVDLLRELNAGQ